MGPLSRLSLLRGEDDLQRVRWAQLDRSRQWFVLVESSRYPSDLTIELHLDCNLLLFQPTTDPLALALDGQGGIAKTPRQSSGNW